MGVNNNTQGIDMKSPWVFTGTLLKNGLDNLKPGSAMLPNPVSEEVFAKKCVQGRFASIGKPFDGLK